MARLFVAVDVPKRVREVCASAQEQLRAIAPSARWIPPENIHLTVKFLGSVADDRIPEIAEALTQAAQAMLDFPARTAGVGAFPSARRAKVLWVGLEDAAGGSGVVAEAVADAMAPLGFPAEDRPFRPHLTIGRLPVPAPVDLGGVAPPAASFTVDRITLFQSHLGRGPARYEGLVTIPFRSG